MRKTMLRLCLILLAASILWTMTGCASTLEVRQAHGTCVLRGEINTGTTVVCSQQGVAVERRSVSDTAGAVLPAVLEGVLRGLIP